MSEQKNNTEEKKENKKADEQKKNWGERIAEQVAGDNELLKNAIKLLAHPIVLIGGLIALLYWLFNSKEKKAKLENLEKENKELKEELNGLTENFHALKDKHRSLRSRFFMKEDEDEQEDSLNGYYGRKEKKESYSQNRHAGRNRYRSSYLD